MGSGTQAVCDAFDVKPGGHCWHCPLPGEGAMKPFGQVVQVALPGTENVPAGQVEQLELAGPENVPAGQLEQNALPGVENVPGAQVEQIALPGPEKRPPGQGEHDVLPEPGAKNPGLHGEHGTLPLGLQLPGEQSWADAGELPARTRIPAKTNVERRMNRFLGR